MNKELVKQLEEEFAKTRKELGFKATLDELDDVFFIRDLIQQTRFISTSLSKAICSRIRDLFNSWTGYLHTWLMPNPSSLIGVTEHRVFDDEDKKRITHIINVFMAFFSQNNIIGLSKDKAMEAKFIDDSLRIWNENKDELIRLSKKTNDYWKKEAEKSN